VFQELYIVGQLIGFAQFFNNQDILRYSFYILSSEAKTKCNNHEEQRRQEASDEEKYQTNEQYEKARLNDDT
jgi:hypothetical protein